MVAGSRRSPSSPTIPIWRRSTGSTSRPGRKEPRQLDAMRRSREVYGYITDVTEIADDGWYGNPAWADEERAADFAKTVADEIAGAVESILEVEET